MKYKELVSCYEAECNGVLSYILSKVYPICSRSEHYPITLCFSMREFYLSSSMLASETGIAYEVSDSYGSRRYDNNGNSSSERIQYVISMAHSQGFDWNQDFFATRYEQMCQVVYDGHVDSIESVIEGLKCEEEAVTEKTSENEDENMDHDGRPITLSSKDTNTHYRYSPQVYRRISDAFIRPRRKSDRSISFSADREQGNFKRTEVTVIDVESETLENKLLKSLVRS